MASNVPKFASFRPKPKVVAEPPKDARISETKATGKSEKKIPNDKTRSVASEIPKHERDSSLSKTYFSDRRGDPEVLRYGTLNRYDIPAYRRIGYGHVLGLDTDQKIDRSQSSDSKIYITPATRQRQERLLTQKSAAKEGSRTLRFIKGNDTQTNIDLDFIPVSSVRRKKNGSGEEEEDALPDPDYRDIELKRDSSQPLDDDTRYESDEPGSLDTGAQITTRNSQLVRRTRESPEDIQAWLEFIEHQEAMMSLDHYGAELTIAARRQLADVRIPLYEEALKKVRNDAGNHITLYKGLFNEAQRSWDDAKVNIKWRDVLGKYPGSVELWFMYLDFIQTNFARFKYETCWETFCQCLTAIQAHAKDIAIETMLHVFVRMTSMIQNAGYQELALAIWQAVLSYHLLRPTNTSADPKENLRDFEEFWESEAPRIGEVGASGWRKAGPEDLPAGALTLESKDALDSLFEDFRKRETEAITKLRYPGRTSDEIGEDDAFHTIFFADIEEYLKLIPADTSSTLIVEAFICFCGLPPLPRAATLQQAWWKDPFLSHASPGSSTSEDYQSNSDPFALKVMGYGSCQTRSVQMTSDLLFNHHMPLDGSRLSTAFVRRVLKLIATDLSSDEILAEYLLAFESRHFPSDAFKTAKQLLKARPTSQRLYNMYGLMESRRGNFEKANQVFGMAISLSSTKPLATFESLMLLNSWVWEALHKDDQVEALWRLSSSSGKVPTRNDPMLRPEQSILESSLHALSKTTEGALLRQDYSCAVISSSLIALLAYLSQDCNADAALAAHEHLFAWFKSNKLTASPYAELNSQCLARLLTYHVTHASIVKPSLIRSTLEPRISIFPDNIILLSVYAANEARFSIDDRVRGIMHQTALQSSASTSIAGWSFAIHYETLRGEIAGSTSHSIRALYKRATNSDSSGAHCPALWNSYLSFELAQLQLERSKTASKKSGKDGKKRTWESRLEEAELRVKETFYQGLRNLPWCKDFIMLAFTDARSIFTEEELWKVYRVMQEKELRIYIELD